MTPDEIQARLDWIERSLDQHVHWIVETARAARAGGGEAGWSQVLAHYRVAPESDDFRRRAVEELRLAAGAVIPEVRRALEMVASQARGELERLQELEVGTSPRLAQLESRVACLADAESRRYASLLPRLPDPSGPGPAQPGARAAGAGVGSLFANAKATSAKVPWADYKMEAANVLRCPSCGGPQEVPLDFRCKYCRAPMGK